jgi:hypothetical protein
MTPPTYRKSTHAYEHPSAAEDVMRQVDVYVPDSMNVSADGIDLLVSAQLHLSYQLLISFTIKTAGIHTRWRMANVSRIIACPPVYAVESS